MKFQKCLRFCFLIFCIIFASGCNNEESPNILPHKIKTIILITIDTWRWDANGFLGKMNPSPTPFLDKAASSSLVATNAWAPVPITAPSHWSMLTGRWPWRDHVHVNGDEPRKGHGSTLAQILSNHNWRTCAFVSCRVLDHRFGFANGFQHFNDHVSYDGGLVWKSMAERRGDVTIRESIKWIKSNIKSTDKLFAWIHLFDPHFPYDPPTGPLNGKNGKYHGEVYFADQQIKLFAQAMRAIGRPVEDSLMVIISDHGEGLGEHGEESHGLILHGATLRIPLIISGPGIANKRTSQLVSTVDIFPTILDYIGIEIEERDGINILKTFNLAERSIPMESKMGVKSFGISEVMGIRYQNWLMEISPLAHLWDVEKDIKEKLDLSSKFSEKIRFLKKLRSSFGTSKIKKNKMDPSMVNDLQSLGYLPGNYTKGTGDVRKFLKVGGKLQFQILAFRQRKKYIEANEAAKKFLLRYPKSPGMWQVAGFISLHLRDFDEAERRFQKSIETDPTNSAPYLNLGNIHFSKKRYDKAIDSYEEVLKIDPEDMFALHNLGLIFLKKNQLGQASKYWRTYLKLYPNHKNALAVKNEIQRWKQK